MIEITFYGLRAVLQIHPFARNVQCGDCKNIAKNLAFSSIYCTRMKGSNIYQVDSFDYWISKKKIMLKKQHQLEAFIASQ